MKIELLKIPDEGLFIDTDIILAKDLYKKSSINGLQNVHLKGIVKYDYESNLCLDLDVTGEFLLSDSITLDEITYPFNFKLEEKVEDFSTFSKEFYEKSQNTLDISEILWENIVLEIPISATKENSDKLSLKGEGWELVNKNRDKIDPRWSKLNELFVDGKE